MKSIKVLYQENKQKIKVIGCIAGVAVIGTIAYKLTKKFVVIDGSTHNIISWKPRGGFMTLERAKEVLDLNEGNVEAFAIVKEGVDKDTYSCVLLSANVITGK